MNIMISWAMLRLSKLVSMMLSTPLRMFHLSRTMSWLNRRGYEVGAGLVWIICLMMMWLLLLARSLMMLLSGVGGVCLALLMADIVMGLLGACMVRYGLTGWWERNTGLICGQRNRFV